MAEIDLPPLKQIRPHWVTRPTRDRLLRVVGTMTEQRSVQAVILAGTELPLILTDPAASKVLLLDTTSIHVRAAVAQLWESA